MAATDAVDVAYTMLVNINKVANKCGQRKELEM